MIAYAEAMTSAPEPQLRATAMNALAHGADSLYTPLADPISRETALRGAELIAGALDQPPEERDRAALALGALLCAIAVDRAGFALHHVLGQTAVRVLGIPHAETYAALLPQHDGARCGLVRPSRSRRWRRPSAPSPTGSRSESTSSPASAGSASSVPIAAGSTRWSIWRCGGPSSPR